MMGLLELYKTLKFIFLTSFIMGLLVVTQSVSVKAQVNVLVDPPCETTTCISQEAIDIAQGRDVGHQAYSSFADQLHYLEPCSLPKQTGVEIYRQTDGGIDIFPDTFCSNLGCGSTNQGKDCQ